VRRAEVRLAYEVAQQAGLAQPPHAGGGEGHRVHQVTLAGLPHLALTAIGRDRPGIVATLTGVLLEHDLNIEDSQATILRGHFSIVLVVAAPEGFDRDRLREELASAGEEIGLEAIVLQDIDELEPQAPEPSHLLTVYGVDHPGIVHTTTRTLAAAQVDITDLNTRLVEDDGEEPLTALMMELALPPGASADSLETALQAVAESEGVEVTLREIDDL
jgi:glycine cleavage system transcriptional repressor